MKRSFNRVYISDFVAFVPNGSARKITRMNSPCYERPFMVTNHPLKH